MVVVEAGSGLGWWLRLVVVEAGGWTWLVVVKAAGRG